MNNLFSAPWSGTPVSRSRTSSRYGLMLQTIRHEGRSRQSKFGRRCWGLSYEARAMNDQGENEAFARLIVAIEPWLGEVVIIGGWAHQLYRLHPSAQALDYVPLTTLDTDGRPARPISVSGQDIRERLLANGFSEQRFGD